MLISLLLAIGVPEDPAVIRAHLAERYSAISSLDVTYVSRWSTTEKSLRYRWLQSGPKRALRVLGENGEPVGLAFYYDGHRTLEFFHRPADGESDPSVKVRIVSHAPDSHYLNLNKYDLFTGVRLNGFAVGLDEILRGSSVRFAGPWCEQGLDLVEFRVAVPDDGQNESRVLRVGLDPKHDYMARRVRDEYVTKQGRRIVTQVLVKSVVAAEDGVTGHRVMLPKTGTYEATVDGVLEATLDLEVESLSLNEQIPGVEFAPTIPFGAQIREDSSVPGEPPITKLQGGDAALRARQDRIEERVSAEISRLKAEGSTFDATPAAGYQYRGWLYAIAVGLLFLATVKFLRK